MSLLLTTTDAAEHLGWRPNTLEKLRVRGEGPPFVKLGRSVRYRACDIEAYVAARVVNSTSEVTA